MYRDLVDRMVRSLASAGLGCPFALASKGQVADIIDGLSDLDFRLVLDTRDSVAWRRGAEAMCVAFLEFAALYPNHWRLVEHLPGWSFSKDELGHKPVCWERLGWEVLWESAPGVALPADDASHEVDDHVGWYIRLLMGYRKAYDAAIDPPIHVAAEQIPQFRAFSICWHYYAPALRCVARAMGRHDVVGKWDALRWHAESGARLAIEVMHVAEAGFRDCASGLAARCSADVRDLVARMAEQLTGAATEPDGDPFAVLEPRALKIDMDVEDRLIATLGIARMFPSRWRYYVGTPEGFDLASCLRIDRGHLGHYCLRFVLESDAAMAALRACAVNARTLDSAIEQMMREHRSTDTDTPPREKFAMLRETYLILLDALERWHQQRGTA
ncbi:MAG: hypothetical protein CMJ49_10180 [Planctomycetaceae bacterium]|nr:hypothetical protein [Planctomycetaceae bacterium]